MVAAHPKFSHLVRDILAYRFAIYCDPVLVLNCFGATEAALNSQVMGLLRIRTRIRIKQSIQVCQLSNDFSNLIRFGSCLVRDSQGVTLDDRNKILTFEVHWT